MNNNKYKKSEKYEKVYSEKKSHNTETKRNKNYEK